MEPLLPVLGVVLGVYLACLLAYMLLLGVGLAVSYAGLAVLSSVGLAFVSAVAFNR